jgi:hypothetical protein
VGMKSRLPSFNGGMNWLPTFLTKRRGNGEGWDRADW